MLISPSFLEGGLCNAEDGQWQIHEGTQKGNGFRVILVITETVGKSCEAEHEPFFVKKVLVRIFIDMASLELSRSCCKAEHKF